MSEPMSIGQMPEQIKASDFKQINPCLTFVRHAPDKIYATLGHEEMTSLQPMKSIFVLDVELIMTVTDAEALANNLMNHVNIIKTTVVMTDEQ